MKTSAPRRRQRGAALLLMMLAVLVAATAILVTRLDLNEIRTRRQTDAQAALANAREALIDYATVRPDLAPGAPPMLPCPDLNGGGGLLEGEAHTATCGAAGVTMIGRLPWRTLGIAPARDSSEACLWYVVSGTYKEAAGATASLINTDSNGQLQLFGVESGGVIAGLQPDERPVAMIIAPMAAISGQVRPAPASATDLCSANFAASRFLDTDSGSGISNATLSGAADGLDILATAAGYAADHNDRIAVVTREALARRVAERHDFDTTMRDLGLAVTGCVADYAQNNPGGPTDKRLPWPAPVAMADYRPDSAYDDLAGGVISGRLADAVDDSNAETGNPIARILSDCDPAAVAEWTPEMYSLWRHWKDHFFYAVAESSSPDATPGGGPPGGGPPGGGPPGGGPPGGGPPGGGPPGGGPPGGGPPGGGPPGGGPPGGGPPGGGPPGGGPPGGGPPGGGPPGGGPPLPGGCTDCFTVNGAGSYAAIVMFSGPRLVSLGQIRNAPPTDTDTKNRVENYLEGANTALVPVAGGVFDFESQPASSNFNDRLFCIDETLNVAEC